MCFRAYSVKSGMSLSVSIAPLRTHPRFLIESFVFNPVCCLFGSEWDFLFSGVSSVRHDSDAACREHEQTAMETKRLAESMDAQNR